MMELVDMGPGQALRGNLRVGSNPTSVYEASALRAWQISVDNKSTIMYNTCIR